MRSPESNICYLWFVICGLLFVVCYLWFVVGYLFTVEVSRFIHTWESGGRLRTNNNHQPTERLVRGSGGAEDREA